MYRIFVWTPRICHPFLAIHNPVDGLHGQFHRAQCTYPAINRHSSSTHRCYLKVVRYHKRTDVLTIADWNKSSCSPWSRTKKQISEPGKLPRFEKPNENHLLSVVNASSTLNRTSRLFQSTTQVNFISLWSSNNVCSLVSGNPTNGKIDKNEYNEMVMRIRNQWKERMVSSLSINWSKYRAN